MTQTSKPLSVVVAYRGIPHARGWATGASLARAFRRLGHEVFEYGNYYLTPEPLQEGDAPKEPDLLVFTECNDEDRPYYELKKMKAGARVYWDFDIDNGRWDITSKLINKVGFDVIFHANKRYNEKLQKLAKSKAVFLPYAYDDEHFFPDSKIKKTVDAGLVGTPYDARREYATRLKELGVDLQFISGVYREDLRKAINGLKIHLNLNIFGPGGDGLLVGRVWETIGCGTFLLNQRKDFIEDFFEDGKHLVLFDNEQDCTEKIKYYLKNDKEREKIARQGWEHGQKHHTYMARAKTIIKEAGLET
ncbi:MAG TPA: glycosyltransferase [Candidatus Dormibacteraeota bacterium]|nr:glycosyltransferase [Candidatus Dormibacteraeota bacterium]